MKKLFAALTGLFAAAVLVMPAQAAFRFDIEEGYNIFNDNRIEGQSRHFGFAFDLNEDIDLGFYFENADLQLTGDVGATPPNTTKLGFDAQAVRVTKKFSKFLDAGVDLGTAKIQQGSTSGAFAATAAINQNKPFVGIHGTARYATDIKDKLSADMHVSIGYRFLDLNDTAVGGAPAGEKTVDDLNALQIGVGVGFRF